MLDQCSKISDRVRIQSELEEAGLDINFLEQQLRQKFGNSTHRIWSEIQKWRELQIDLQDSLQNQHENMKLKKEVQLLRDALKRLRDERKGILNIHKQLKANGTQWSKRLQDIALKSRVMMTPPVRHPTRSVFLTRPPRYNTQTNLAQQDIHDSELDEILIDIPTIQAGSILDVHSSGNPGPGSRTPRRHCRPTTPNCPIPVSAATRRRIRSWTPTTGTIRTSPESSWKEDITVSGSDSPRPLLAGDLFQSKAEPQDSVSMQGWVRYSSWHDDPSPGQNKTKCADILGIQNIPPPPLPQRPATPKAANQKKSHKKRSSSSTRDKSKEKGKSFLPRSPAELPEQGKDHQHQLRKFNWDWPAPNFPSPTDSVKYNGNNKLWNKKLQTATSTTEATIPVGKQLGWDDSPGNS
ncbi:hypothetical protein CEXT_218661 [Caerostris extrusa]|uniref:Uncharacterized protein n=1 Tax=Caerostris extrusa TaxID=172846 RepID=A0AAV4MHX8_CAEEX|nr:hypothetical protein CEXT_218661 [Caerostris extrusa]